VTWAYQNTDLQRLEIIAGVGNVASRRVAEKLGAECEGLLRKRLFLNGRPEDALMLALVRGDEANVGSGGFSPEGNIFNLKLVQA
jgi:RimJ/RimL family protein N-acetyltransferase